MRVWHTISFTSNHAINKTKTYESVTDLVIDGDVYEHPRCSGKWIFNKDHITDKYLHNYYVCSVCGFMIRQQYEHFITEKRFRYCPSCGAYMGGA